MIKSMTGFGRHTDIKNGKSITVEIKSVNHRYFEFSARVPRVFGFLEEKMKSFVQSQVSRGKVDVFIMIDVIDDSVAEVMVNQSLTQGYLNALSELSERYGLRNDVTVTTLSRYPDIFTVHKSEEDADELWADVKAVAQVAMEQFVKMRADEGERLKRDVLQRAEIIMDLVGCVEERSPQIVAEYRSKLRARMNEILGDNTVDEQRLLTEAAIFADKVAVAEETVRLRSHFEQLNSMLSTDEAIGRKLDFLVQEMNRETNTIGSKAQDTEVARIVIDIKAEIEKIREQIQNIE